MQAGSVIDNPERSRFELDVDGRTVFATYQRQGPVLYIRHVEAPVPLRGTGAAGRLMQGIVEIARAEHLKLAPLCGYAATWIRRHKVGRDLLA
jgi:predicted GNAT family acetyltransferase